MTIDIMMPYYGDPGLFRAAVESVLIQTNLDWRLVIIDDRYPDSAPGEWVRSIGDSRIHYVLNEANLGVSGNFSKAVRLVQSEHFVMMGCDDLLEPGYVAQMHSAISRFPNASYFQPAVTVVGDDGEALLPLADRVKAWYRPKHSEAIELSGEDLAVSLVRGNWTYFPSICWHTQTVRKHGFNAEFEVVLDLALQLDIVLGKGTMVLLPQHEFRYRRHEGSVSSWTARDGSRFDEERAFFLRASSMLRLRGWKRAARVAGAHFSSRLNAATKIPSALANRDLAGVQALMRHLFTGWR